LSIQFLQKSIREGSPNVKQLSETMAATLIEQIDQLAKIAGDFSQFANIGNVHLEKFDISDSISSLILLHANNEQIHFDWQQDDLPAIIYADRVQINRLLTNLFKNAIEAGIEQFGEVYVLIQQKIKQHSVEISIQDRSGGIPDDVKKHIFSPNFTTKSSGSGLGLAICKGIVEKANGSIEFSSIAGVGTIFTITLPLHSEPL
jgi:signal transduction histidine kinase